ncbi:MAG TPA: ABC transporter substrate-binding protein [Acidimicrobiia bacterium]|nr:ABC transporter substrate-binding protein [Acidimicrobiia bacterium]
MGRYARALIVAVALVGVGCGTRLDEDAVRRRAQPATDSQPATAAADPGGGVADGSALPPETPTTAGSASTPTEAGAREVEVVQRVTGPASGSGRGASASGAASGRPAGPSTAASPAPGSAAGGPTTPAAGGEPIKIGGVFPLSGGISALGRPAQLAAAAYFRSINDAGGINGRRIEFIAEDDGGDPNRTRAAAEKLVEKDRIFAMGPSFTPFSPDLVPFLQGKGVPFIGFDGVNVEGFTSPSTVTAGASIAPHARALIPYWVDKTKAKRIGVVYLDVPPAVSYLNETKNVICPKLGCEVVAAQPVQFTTTDYTSILLRMQTARAEGIFIVTDPGSAVKLLLQARQQQYTPSPGGYLGQHGIYLDLVPGSCGKFCDGIMAPTSLFPPQVKSAATDEMRTTVGRYYSNVDYGYFTELGYVSAKLLVDLLRRAGTPDRGRVLDAARALTAWDSGGFTNPARPVDVSPGREHPRDIIIMRMEGGTWKQETGWITPQEF